MIRERERNGLPGLPVLFLLLLSLPATGYLFLNGAGAFDDGRPNAPLIFTAIALFVLEVILLAGHFVVPPNSARVLQLFGDYVGTAKVSGLRWANPFLTKKLISLRVRNFESSHLKVNDKEGNPVEIAAVIVWRVRDSAKATFDVDKYEQFVAIQSETAVRHLASQYPYDAHDEETVSLRGSMDQISEFLRNELQQRLDKAGVEIQESRLSHLAYGPEIAGAMLRRQQAGAVVAARRRIVDGAVGMVEMALERLAQNNVVDLDEEKKAAMVSNLLVVLCGEQAASPVINAGTLHN